MRKNKKYSPELKIAAVKSYLAGEGSLIQTCKKFGILRHKQLQDWIMWYNGHKDIKWCNSAKGEIYMTKGRKTTQEERAKIVAFCIEHNYDYGLTVETLQSVVPANICMGTQIRRRRSGQAQRQQRQNKAG